MLLIITAAIGIPLTIVAWFRGWKWRSLLPLPIGISAELLLGFIIGLFLVGAGGIDEYSFAGLALVLFIIEIGMDLAIIGILIYMVAKGRVEEKPVIFNAPVAAPGIPVYNPPAAVAPPVYSAPPVAPATPTPIARPAAAFEPATTPAPVNIAKLVLPDNRETLIRGTDKILGRHDFGNVVSPEEQKYISRQHLIIKTDGSRYYAEDRGSSNGTKINDVSITGKGRWELKDGDRIKLADVVTLQFRLSSAF